VLGEIIHHNGWYIDFINDIEYIAVVGLLGSRLLELLNKLNPTLGVCLDSMFARF